MANNTIQVKRTSTTGRTPNTTSSANTQYIEAGELALNMADGILYSSNGSTLITIGSNLVNQSVTGTLTVKSISSNGSLGTSGQVLTSNGSSTYWAAGGGGGGGASVTVSDTPPGGASENSLWWSSSLSKMFIYYNDGDTLQWVEDSTNFSGFDATNDLDAGGATSNYYNRLVDGGAA